MEVSAPEAHVFESQSGGVFDMVKVLGEKFEEQRDTLEKEEMNDKHSFNMMAQDLLDQIESATKNREEKSPFKSQRESDKADFPGEFADTQATLAAHSLQRARPEHCDCALPTGTSAVTAGGSGPVSCHQENSGSVPRGHSAAGEDEAH